MSPDPFYPVCLRSGTITTFSTAAVRSHNERFAVRDRDTYKPMLSEPRNADIRHAHNVKLISGNVAAYVVAVIHSRLEDDPQKR